VDTRTLLENNRAVLDGSDCSDIGNPTALRRGGKISRMMIARLNRIQEAESPSEESHRLLADRPRVNYHTARSEEDPFPDPSLLDPVDTEQHAEIRTKPKL